MRAEPGAEPDIPPGTEPASLRRVGALLSGRDAGLATHAVALANWHAENGFCSRCGSPTRIEAAGHVRICDRDGGEHFPRMDPAVIMLVHREVDGVEQCLLAHNPAWPEGRYSVLAGFVEPGESLEQAVARGRRRGGDRGRRPRLHGSAVTVPAQPDGRPRGPGSAPRTDHEEIADIRWFAREELRDAVERGEILLPGPVSIAHKLIERWYGGRLPHSEWTSR